MFTIRMASNPDPLQVSPNLMKGPAGLRPPAGLPSMKKSLLRTSNDALGLFIYPHNLTVTLNSLVCYKQSPGRLGDCHATLRFTSCFSQWHEWSIMQTPASQVLN